MAASRKMFAALRAMCSCGGYYYTLYVQEVTFLEPDEVWKQCLRAWVLSCSDMEDMCDLVPTSAVEQLWMYVQDRAVACAGDMSGLWSVVVSLWMELVKKKSRTSWELVGPNPRVMVDVARTAVRVLRAECAAHMLRESISYSYMVWNTFRFVQSCTVAVALGSVHPKHMPELVDVMVDTLNPLPDPALQHISLRRLLMGPHWVIRALQEFYLHGLAMVTRDSVATLSVALEPVLVELERQLLRDNSPCSWEKGAYKATRNASRVLMDIHVQWSRWSVLREAWSQSVFRAGCARNMHWKDHVGQPGPKRR